MAGFQLHAPGRFCVLGDTIEVMLPTWESEGYTVTGLVSREFNRSVISSALAQRFGLTPKGTNLFGTVVLQSAFEGDLVQHRSVPIRLEFRVAHERAGESYLHFSYVDMEDIFHIKEFPQSQSDDRFLVLVPDDPETFCIQIPFER